MGTTKIAIELHDSVIGSLSSEGSDLKLSLNPAYVHRSIGIPGIDPGDGLVQDAIITIRDGSVAGELPEFPTHILDGECLLGSQTIIDLIHLPLDQEGSVSLVLHVAPDYRKIVMTGKHISIRMIGNARWVERVN